MKKFLILFLCVVLILSLSAGIALASNTPSTWAQELVNDAISEGLVPRNLQSSYTQATTRAEFTALAVALYEKVMGEITGRTTFSDTSDINVQKAAFIGVVQGVGGNRFDPTAKLSREQAATMLARLANAAGNPIPNHTASFNDIREVASWATAAVGQMQLTGVMGGVGGNRFDPKNDYTREQSIMTIMRLFNIVGDTNPPIDPILEGIWELERMEISRERISGNSLTDIFPAGVPFFWFSNSNKVDLVNFHAEYVPADDTFVGIVESGTYTISTTLISITDSEGDIIALIFDNDTISWRIGDISMQFRSKAF